MQSYKCPNCGRVYNYGDNISTMIQCSNCRYPLKRAEKVKEINHPELNPMLNNDHVIGEIKNSNKFTPKCPTCGSTNIKKIGTINRMVSTGLFGLASSKIGKQWHCNSCNSDF